MLNAPGNIGLIGLPGLGQSSGGGGAGTNSLDFSDANNSMYIGQLV